MSTENTETKGTQRRVGELAPIVTSPVLPTVVGDTSLSADEVSLVGEWKRLATDIAESKFDCCLSGAYDSVTFDGLNRSVSDKYLSDDPVHAFGFQMDGFDFSRLFGELRAGYAGFDYAEYETLLLDEEFMESDELRASVAKRRSAARGPRAQAGAPARKSFAGQRAAMARGATLRAAAAAVETAEEAATRSLIESEPFETAAMRRFDAPDAPAAPSVEGAAGELLLPGDTDGSPERRPAAMRTPTARSAVRADATAAASAAARNRADVAYTQPYPAALGRTGAVLLTPSQRRFAAMTSSTRPARAEAVSRAARTLTRNEQLTGSAVSREPSAGTPSPVRRPAAIDATFLTAPAGESSPSPARGTTSSAPSARRGALSLGADLTHGMPAGQAAPRAAAARRVVLDGFVISSDRLPALTGAIELAQAAFGGPSATDATGGASPRMGGVFSPARFAQSLQIARLDTSTDASSSAAAAPAYESMVFDAAEMTWLAGDEQAPARFDAAKAPTAARRNGRAVPPAQAAAQLIARSLATPDASLAARAAGAQQASLAAIAGTSTSLQGVTAPESAPSKRAATRTRGGRAEGATRPVAAGVPREPTESAMFQSLRRVTAPIAGATDTPAFAQSVQSYAPSAAARRQANASLGAARAPAANAIALDRLVSFAAPPAADAPARRGAAPIYTSARGPISVTATRPELFAAQHLASMAADANLPALVRSAEAPVTIAGEVRYGYGSIASPMDDPVVYLSLADDAGSGLRKDTAPAARRAARMSPVVAANLRSVSMPLSSAARLSEAARVSRPVRATRDASSVDAVVAAASPSSFDGARTASLAGGLRGTGTPARGAAPRRGLASTTTTTDAATTLPQASTLRATRGEAHLDSMGLAGASAASMAFIPLPTATTRSTHSAVDVPLHRLASAARLGSRRPAPGAGSAFDDRTSDLVHADTDGAASGAPRTGPEAAARGALRFGAATTRPLGASLGHRGFVPLLDLDAGALGLDAFTVSSASIAAGAATTTASAEPVFFQFAYDAETAFLRGDMDGAIAGQLAGSHVEVRGGRVVRAVPATQAAERAARVRSATGAATATGVNRLPALARLTAQSDVLGARPTADVMGASPISAFEARTATAGIRSATTASASPELTAQARASAAAGAAGAHVRTGQSTPLVAGASLAESGYPTLALHAEHGQAARIGGAGEGPATSGVVAAVTESELSMLPPMVRALVERQARESQSMTRGGSDVMGALARLAALSDIASPAGRTAVLHQLSALGIDAPELLRVLDGDSATGPAAGATTAAARGKATAALTAVTAGRAETPDGRTGSLLRAGVRTPAEALLAGMRPDGRAATSGTPAAAAEAAVTTGTSPSLDRQLRRLAAAATGIGATETTMLREHGYFGPYSPLALERAGGAEAMLRSLLGARAGDTSRAMAASWAAELGETLSLELPFEKGGAAIRAAAQSKGRQLATKPNATQIAAQARAARTEAATLSARAEARAAALAGAPGRSGVTAPSALERLLAQAPGAPGQAIGASPVASWDAATLPLAALTDVTTTATGPSALGLVSRIDGAVAPWSDPAAATRTDTLRGLGWDADAMPLMAGEDDRSTTTAQARAERRSRVAAKAAERAATARTAAAARRASSDDAPRSGRSRPAGADGPRGFSAISPTSLRNLMAAMPTNKAISSFLGGGFDFAYAVLDRVNGSFAGLDAGVVAALQRAQAEAASGEGRVLQPGMDAWPEDLRSFLMPDSAQPPARKSSGSSDEARVARLERRVGAAREAYDRLRVQRDRTGAVPSSLESVDWNLIQTGAQNATPGSADLGRLASTMSRPAGVQQAEMSYLAPAVKVVAQQAQLKPESEPVGGRSGGAQSRGGDAGGGAKTPQKIDIEKLAMQIAPNIMRKFARERDRHGRG